MYLARSEDNYAIGDEAPVFRVPAINHCDETAPEDSCDLSPACFDSREPMAGNQPLLLAFFSSW